MLNISFFLPKFFFYQLFKEMTDQSGQGDALQAIRYSPESFRILDRLRLPHESVYVDTNGPEDAFVAIKTMQVRGAPAIAIVAALSVAVELRSRFPGAGAD